ncbi:MAG TPA: MFS transporter [Bryobacteraceae bacterium]|jgi:MFS family permease
MAPLHKKWQTVMLLAIIAGLNYADRTAISTVFPLVRADLNLTDVAMAAIGSVFLWAYAVGSPVAGYLADRVSRSRMILWSLLGWSAATIATAFVHSTNAMLVTRVFLGIAECAYLPAAVALIADHHGPETRATAMGLHLAGLNAGLIGGGFACGYLGEHFGWRSDFLFLGCAGFLLAIVVKLVLRDAPAPAIIHREAPGPARVLTLLRVVTADAILIEAMLVATGTWMFLNWLPLYYKETFNLSLAAAGFSGTFMIQMAAVIGITVGGVISDRLSGGILARRVLLLAVCYFCAAPFLASFIVHPGFSAVSASIFSYSLLRSIGSCNEHPILCEILPHDLRATAIGLQNTLSCMAGGIGVLAAGYLKHDWGLEGVFGGVSLLVLMAGAVVLAAYRLLVRDRSSARVECEVS